MDSDLATPVFEARRLLQNQGSSGLVSIWASRSPKVGSPIQRELIRGFLGRVFNFMVRLLLNIPIYDTQCGAKFFTKDAAKLAFSEPFISRWIFDVEIYMRLRGCKVVEAPLDQWREVPGSQMRVFKETFRVLGDLFRILGKYGRT
jgi:dolichyl-phosphate beta-glucosyltransferase